MDRREFLTRSLALGLASGGTCTSIGCGTMFHQDRVGQPHSRDIDWKVAGLNALGLAFFFVPGVVAFAVDFYTGAIYLPYESYGAAPGYQPDELPAAAVELTQGDSPGVPRPGAPTDSSNIRSVDQRPRPDIRSFGSHGFRKIEVSPAKMNQQAIAQAVGQQLRKQVSLSDPRVRVSPLSELDQFAATHRRHVSDPSFGVSPQQFFERLPAV